MSISPRRLLLATVAVLAYAGLLVGVWATRPLHDSIPVGMDYSPTLASPPEPARLLSVDVTCNALFSSSPSGDEPLPELTAQPEGFPALAFQREPCALVHRNARVLFVVNVLAVVATLTVIGLVARRLRRRSGDDVSALPVTA